MNMVRFSFRMFSPVEPWWAAGEFPGLLTAGWRACEGILRGPSACQPCGRCDTFDFMGGAPSDEMWIDRASYSHLVKEFSSPTHRSVPSRLLISGLLFRNQSDFHAEFRPIQHLEAGEVIEGEIPPGNMALELLNQSGQVLLALNFTPSFSLSSYGGEYRETNVTSFSFILEEPSDVREVTLSHGGNIIENVEASAHPPVIAITWPAPWVVFKQNISIQWNATDADGDPLVYGVGISSDGGFTWHTVAMNLPTTTAEFDINETFLNGTEDFLIRVRASDGFWTSEDLQNASFAFNQTCSDVDGDSVCDISDNCVADVNPLQENFEGDALGDICDSDDDDDGVRDLMDRCPFSVLPELVPTQKLLPNHFADTDGDGWFESAAADHLIDNALHFNATRGCSCAEVLAVKGGQDLGQNKYGCTGGTLQAFIRGRVKS